MKPFSKDAEARPISQAEAEDLAQASGKALNDDLIESELPDLGPFKLVRDHSGWLLVTDARATEAKFIAG